MVSFADTARFCSILSRLGLCPKRKLTNACLVSSTTEGTRLSSRDAAFAARRVGEDFGDAREQSSARACRVPLLRLGGRALLRLPGSRLHGARRRVPARQQSPAPQGFSRLAQARLRS